MKYRYYRGESKNPYGRESEPLGPDPRGRYWFCEKFMLDNLVNRTKDFTEGISGYPCQIWPDFIRRAKADLNERGLAFEIDFQNGKYNMGEDSEDWYSYFEGPRPRWQQEPCDIPETRIDVTRYAFTDASDSLGCASGRLIVFGPIVGVIYRGTTVGERDDDVPVFEIENLRGDKLYVTAPGYLFRYGQFQTSARFIENDGSETAVYIYDSRLHVALSRLVLDDSAPVICVGERLPLPTLAEVPREMKWYRLDSQKR